jgi:hypothetical protein
MNEEIAYKVSSVFYSPFLRYDFFFAPKSAKNGMSIVTTRKATPQTALVWLRKKARYPGMVTNHVWRCGSNHPNHFLLLILKDSCMVNMQNFMCVVCLKM